jgi:uncharacterized damage-inducible protein DinB
MIMEPVLATGEDELEQLRYPVGRLRPRRGLDDTDRARLIADIAALPARLSAAVAGLRSDQLETPYRPGGWTLRQVVHHIADSHMHSYIRFKLALTADEPAILAYDEAAWARLPDAQGGDVTVSLRLIDALHTRWVEFLRSLDSNDWLRAYTHPELGRVTLEVALQIYGWHSLHHTAHITNTRQRAGWTP